MSKQSPAPLPVFVWPVARPILPRPARLDWCWLLCLILLAGCELRPNPTAVPITAVPTTNLPLADRGTATGDTAVFSPTMTPQATAIPQPTPTYDPTLPDWTLLIYMSAANNLDSAALADLNEMEAAISSARVRVVVQLDRANGATRYQIAPDNDPGQFTAVPQQELGPSNMGEAATLRDFLVWGGQTFPANRYALLLWDHGAGWQGVAFDDQPDHLTLPELETAVSQALSQTGIGQLDLIAFDACLMSQLDVLQTLHATAAYAVASAELTPGQGWDYQTLLSHLAANPQVDGATLAGQMVSDFAQTYSQATPNEFVTMSAIDLARLPAVTWSVETLAATLLTQGRLAAGAIGDAQSGATALAYAYTDAPDPFAALDLRRFAQILAQRSPEPAVQQAAEAVVAAVETAVMTHWQGRGWPNSGGINLYFPRQRAVYTPEYGRVTPLPTWNRFLNSYYDVALDDFPPPSVTLTSQLRDVVGVQSPAYFDFEIAGREMSHVLLLAGRYNEDGRRYLLEYDYLIPEATTLPDGSRLYAWHDGLHEDFFIWDTQVTYLYDGGGQGGFIIMWPTTANGPVFTVPGRYRPADRATFQEASLTFDHQLGQLTGVWSRSGENGAVELSPGPGDEFQVYDFYLEGEGISRQPGGSLFFDGAGLLYFDWRPLPDGAYFLGFAAQNLAGVSSQTLTDLTVVNSTAVPHSRAYLDPYLGFQFLYPDTWYTPIYSGTLLYTSNLTGTTQMQLSIYPNLRRDLDVNALQQQTLAQFGRVDVLFSDEVAIAGMRGLRTVYGYRQANEAERTGIFVAFVQGNTGFVLDVDGPIEQEGETITAVSQLLTSWQFTGAGFGLQPGHWATIDLDAFTLPKPADFTYQPTNTWQRFSTDAHTFVALRRQPAARTVDAALSTLVSDASAGVNNFHADPARRFALNETVWQRVDFSYTADNQEIWGFIMIRQVNGQEIVAWAEAPRTTFTPLESTVFLVMIADLTMK